MEGGVFPDDGVLSVCAMGLEGFVQGSDAVTFLYQ
jgi:hypothetical protein